MRSGYPALLEKCGTMLSRVTRRLYRTEQPTLLDTRGQYAKIRIVADQPEDWSVEFYEREDGTSPVREFLEGLDDKTQSRFIWSIEQLRLLNVQAREPLVKHIEGKLWELRRTGSRLTRVFFSFLASPHFDVVGEPS